MARQCSAQRGAEQSGDAIIVLLDFHTHTTASDGALTPATLVQRALARGVEQLAITDHDTLAGYRVAARSAELADAGLRLVAGVELSCCWSGVNVHVVGLDVDADHPALADGVARLDAARRERAVVIARRLEKLGMPGALEGAQAEAGDSQIGRPHFAAWMVARGHVSEPSVAFDRYLGRGKPGDVKTFWPTLDEVTAWIVAAGGVAVLAHPLKYRLTRSRLERLTRDFCQAGGGAIEVLTGRQTPDQGRQLRDLARRHQLAVSVGSDFHQEQPWAADIGVEPRHLEGLQGVWERWRPAAQESKA